MSCLILIVKILQDSKIKHILSSLVNIRISVSSNPVRLRLTIN